MTWHDQPQALLEDMLAIAAQLNRQGPVDHVRVFPPDWTMTECGPLPPGWGVVAGKPRRELLAYVHAWRRARALVAWTGVQSTGQVE